ncbi:helix-turn-helix transcriptional regulator [Dactylosporangium matsuzakiense]|uniref:Transcriptional regulator n=1 Tax=Dactylosporangium matsuzakiense TaxID=53360 RepID=A0A9W6NRT7_9ACTN|nr:WYL domain-containing protein [Dactylosporangium matsuzakiense]UWZ49172.1 WYL domain-containing protein [Dactylosporangium matsuzakiense]GLL06763.1 transcriptional regulator [Dactylosporangium matsuzakiense]
MSRPAARVLMLLELLQSGGLRTLAELADRLGVDERTVRRYVEHLIDLDIPVESVRGRYGGYRLGPGYRMPPLMLSDDEALAVLLGLVAATRSGLLDAGATASETALAKIRRVLPGHLARRLDTVLASLTFTAPPATAPSRSDRPDRDRSGSGRSDRGESSSVRAVADPPAAHPSASAATGAVLLTIADAVHHHRPVALRYASRDGRTSARTVHPYGLVVHAGRWYVTAVEPAIGEERTFRLDRIADARTLPGTFAPPTGSDPADRVLRGLAGAPYRYRVTVWIQATEAHIRTRLPAGLATIAAEAAGGWRRADLNVERLDWLPGLLAALDRPFAVERPDELREHVAALADRLRAAAAARPPDIRGPAIPG